MKMKSLAAWMGLLLVANLLTLGMASPSTVPAFLWSPHEELYSSNKIKEVVNYQTIAQEDLAKSVLSEGGWSNFLCSEEELHQQPLDLVVVFVGGELHSSDLSRNDHRVQDPALVDLLKVSFTKSNYSMSFPYVATSDVQNMESSLIAGFTKTCGHGHVKNRVAFTESCSVEGTEYKKLSDLQSVDDFVFSSVGKSKVAADLLVFCHRDSDAIGKPQETESKVLAELIRSVEQSGAKYAALYVSNPFRSIQYPSQRDVERFLAETSNASSTANSTSCDEICQLKSSLLEALLVAVVLLIILISGLCCMMGIDTPTRFETPQDS
uniref:V-type proton ATPase subunit S1/VOA1 transmembrane domain-containing protein n=1 Tax=Kalanchoe fedtschenkoi TaxID=63787 RepID=A0A7N0RIZ5_KALFE